MIAWYDGSQELAAIDRGAYYRSDTKYLAKLVGNEIPAEYRDFNSALHYTNKASSLGLSEKELKVLDYMLTALGEGTRFAAHPAMLPHHGENAATHSLQSVALLERLLHQTVNNAEDKQQAKMEAMAIRQPTAIALLLHDMGEIAGEAGYAVGNAGVRFEQGLNKTEMERELLERSLILAISAVEHGEDKESFLNRMRFMREHLQIEQKAAHGGSLGYSDITIVLGQDLLTPQPLSEEGTEIYAQMMALWHMAEFAGKNMPNPYLGLSENVMLPQYSDYIGLLVKSIEHVQGTRHLLRFGQTQPLLTNADTNEIMGVMAYTEGELAELFAKAKTPFQQGLAQTERNQAYGTLMQYVDTVLSAHHKIEMIQHHLDDISQNKEAKTMLGFLENLLGAYEQAIQQDRIPPQGERSFGAAMFAQLSQATETLNPDNHISHPREMLRMIEQGELRGVGVARML